MTGAFPYGKCLQCPRNCGADRSAADGGGFCGEPDTIRAASACLHFGEEPPLTVFGGSGTVFVTGCNLRCAFCQNYQISQHGMGSVLSAKEFARICTALQREGAENINIVTGSHSVPALAGAIAEAKEAGLSIPVCWNSSAYEKPEVLSALDGLVDIWLPDLKTLNAELSGRLFKAADYPERATEAVLYMLDRSPLELKPVPSPDGTGGEREKMLSGVIVRHLFLPGRMDDTILALDWLKKNADGRAYVSLMSQYTPVPFRDERGEEEARRRRALSAVENRPVSPREFEELQDVLAAYDFKNLFYQELEPDTGWLPDFGRARPFPSSLAKPVWHWRHGFISTEQKEPVGG